MQPAPASSNEGQTIEDDGMHETVPANGVECKCMYTPKGGIQELRAPGSNYAPQDAVGDSC
jgi:hypothetical protein